jgi:hypothetical protein
MTDQERNKLALQLGHRLLDALVQAGAAAAAATPPAPRNPPGDDPLPVKFRDRAYVTRRELRETLRRGETWCRNMERKGVLHPHRMDGHTLYPLADLRALLPKR